MTSVKKIPFRVLGINHIGIVPKNFAVASEFLGECLGLTWEGDEDVADQKTKTRMFLSGSADADIRQAEWSRLELLEPLNGEGPIAKYLDTRGGGIHHVALRVDNVEVALRYLDEQGVHLIDKTPRRGAHDTMIGFIHPKATGGLLLELVQEKTRSS